MGHIVEKRAVELLRQMLGPQAEFRTGQWEAIEKLVIERRRVLIVQRTGWGKSLVYFVATRLLREQGAGPTLLVSPLLALMRNQIQMAERIGVRAFTINSSNTSEWDEAEGSLINDTCDLLLVAPERLNNARFQSSLTKVAGRVGLFVVDEVHCISDWGHDFRPDYRRIKRVLQHLPRGIPVLGTTATANDRVVADVQVQMGPDLEVIRGPLHRQSLRLQNIKLAGQSERLAWLAQYLPKMPGAGIIYCLTIADVERVTGWLKFKGFAVEAYHGELDSKTREEREQSLLDNQVKALVATVALGMGFDKPDLGFVIHYQRPGSVIAYYQQVGRAGRGVEAAYAILMHGREDDQIQDYFIETAFPPATVMSDIVHILERSNTLSVSEMLQRLNVSRSMMDKALKLLEIDGTIAVQTGSSPKRYFRTLNPWQLDRQRMDDVTKLRYDELEQMQAYVDHRACLMEFLLRALDDPSAERCGTCANCRRWGFPANPSAALVAEAVERGRREHIMIEPRKQWPAGLSLGANRNIPTDQQNAPGYALSYYGDAGWGQLVKEGKYGNKACHFADELVDASVDLILNDWKPSPKPQWVAAIPSLRHPTLVPDFAGRLARALGLAFVVALIRTRDAPEQKTMRNSIMQARNVHDTLALAAKILSGPVLLVDDIADSRWTFTLAGWLLRSGGSGIVYPFALACAAERESQR